MEFKRTCFVVLVVSLAVLVADVNAGWKFWKKETTTTTTTTPTPPLANSGSTVAPGGKPSSTTVNTNRAIAGAADPGLAIGIGSTGGTVRQNARPHSPNPGTEVGLDIPGSRPNRPGVGGNNGQGYRDWAVDLTGAGEPGRQGPKLPSQGPALTPGGQQQPSQGNRPASGVNPGSSPSTGPASNQRPGSQVIGGNSGNQRPGSPTSGGIPNSQQGGPSLPQGGSIPQPAQGNAYQGNSDGKPQVSTLHVGPLRPGSPTTPPPLRPGQSNTGPASVPSSPTAGKTFAEVAGGGSRPGSPTPAPRQPGNSAAGQPRPQGSPQYPAQGRPSTGAIAAGGALAGGALAGGAIAAGKGNSAGSSTTPPSTSNAGGKVYSSNPTYSKGNTVTDEDLEKLSEALFIKDTNNANKHITLNLQKQTTGSSPIDEAPQPLFSVKNEALQGNTIQKVVDIFDNYKLDTKTNEYISPAQRQEESLLVDTFLSTNVMAAAMRFLADKGFVRKTYYEYKDTLRRMWFDLFSRGEGKIGSSGFEHVFLSELKSATTGTEVLGLHNWIYYSAEEAANHADYMGYIKKVDLGNKAAIVKIHTKFNGHDKPVTTMFVGTSPELEMALYTVCFFARPDQACPVSLGGTKFNIITHKFKYRGKDLVGTAYPDI